VTVVQHGRAAKYPPILTKLNMVEIDETVVKACKQHLQEVSGNLSDPRVNFIFEDGKLPCKRKERLPI